MSNELKQIQADKQAFLDGLDKGMRRGIAKRLDVPVGKLGSASYADIAMAYGALRHSQIEREVQRELNDLEAKKAQLAAAGERLAKIEKDIECAALRFCIMKRVGNIGLTKVYAINLEDDDGSDHVYIAAASLSDAINRAKEHQERGHEPYIDDITSVTLVSKKGLF